VMLAHIDHEPTPPSQVTELPISPALEELVLACLAKDPADRPPTTADVSRRLRESVSATRWTTQDSERWWTANLPEFGLPATGTSPVD
jgi:serine/threonine-protein kinase